VTAGERGTTMDDRTATSGDGTVVVVAADHVRRSLYESALDPARISARITVDADEAGLMIGDAAPDVLVLDCGLRRLVLFRLYSLVRADATDRPTQVVFVGQGGDTGPDDHYLPGEPSALEVVARVTELLEHARPATVASAPDPRGEAPASTTGAGAAPVEAASVPATATMAGTATDGASDAVPVEPVVDAAPMRSRPRLDALLIRIGLVLLILGALMFFARSYMTP
jgi:hypothetical protein